MEGAARCLRLMWHAWVCRAHSCGQALGATYCHLVTVSLGRELPGAQPHSLHKLAGALSSLALGGRLT